jgi:Flp pilus assembly protein TadG
MTIFSKQKRSLGAGGERGHAVTEVALLSPWLFFLFVATLDFGFYSYWLVAATNAARTAALSAAKNGLDAAVACNQVRNELRGVLGYETATNCNGAPLTVTVEALDDATSIISADTRDSIKVAVMYETKPLIPVPGIVDKFTIRREVEMRLIP